MYTLAGMVDYHNIVRSGRFQVDSTSDRHLLGDMIHVSVYVNVFHNTGSAVAGCLRFELGD